MSKIPFVIMIAAACWIAACQDPNDAPAGRAVISFAMTRQDTVVRETLFNINAGGRRILFSGGYVAPHACFTFQASGDEDGNDLDVLIEATATGQVCPAAVAHFTYALVLGNFLPGDYQVRVRHKDTGGTRTVFDQRINIPF